MRTKLLVHSLAILICAASPLTGSTEKTEAAQPQATTVPGRLEFGKRNIPSARKPELPGTLAREFAQQEVDAKEIILNYLEKLGGVQKLKEIKSCEVTGSFEMPEAGVVGDVSLIQHGDKFLTQIDISNFGVFEFGSNAKDVWELNPQSGDRILTGDDRADAIRNHGRLVPELEYVENFAGTLKTVGTAEVDGKKCHVIEIEPKEGRKIVARFDVDSGLLVQTTNIQNVQGTDIEVLTTYGNYQQVGDVQLPHELRSEISGLAQVMKYEKINLNQEIAPKTFELPEDLRDDG